MNRRGRLSLMNGSMASPIQLTHVKRLKHWVRSITPAEREYSVGLLHNPLDRNTVVAELNEHSMAVLATRWRKDRWTSIWEFVSLSQGTKSRQISADAIFHGAEMTAGTDFSNAIYQHFYEPRIFQGWQTRNHPPFQPTEKRGIDWSTEYRLLPSD